MPPSLAAPSLAAPETPPYPPLIRIAPYRARSFPTSRAASSCDGVASVAPHTATYRMGISGSLFGTLSDEVQRPWGKEVRRSLDKPSRGASRLVCQPGAREEGSF